MNKIIRHIGIGWDINAKGQHCLSTAVCHNINDSEILTASVIAGRNISQSIMEHIHGAIGVLKEGNSTFTLTINHSVNNEEKIKNDVIQRLKRKLKFKECNGLDDTLRSKRIYFEIDSFAIPDKTKRKYEKIFPERIFSKKRSDEFEAEICSVIALLLRCRQLETILPALKIPRIDKLKMLVEKGRGKIKFNKPDFPYLIPNDDFGRMKSGVE